MKKHYVTTLGFKPESEHNIWCCLDEMEQASPVKFTVLKPENVPPQIFAGWKVKAIEQGYDSMTFVVLEFEGAKQAKLFLEDDGLYEIYTRYA